MKSFGSKKNLIKEVKKSHFGKFSDRAEKAMPCYYGPQESLVGFQKIVLLWVQSGKITVSFPYCSNCPNDPKLKIHAKNSAEDPSVISTLCFQLS